MAFNVTFKAHWLCHGLLESGFLSPRVGACMGKEPCSRRTEGHAKVCHGTACRLQPDVTNVRTMYAFAQAGNFSSPGCPQWLLFRIK